MAVKHTETFTFEVPLDSLDPADVTPESMVEVTMGREALTSLYRDLGTALGYSREFQEHHELHQQFEESIFTEPHPGTERLSVEAAAQAMARLEETRQQHLANPNQPRGSAIGNRHT